MAVPSSILRAARRLPSTKRTYTLKPADDLTVKLPIPSSFGDGNVGDKDVVQITADMSKETLLSGKGEVIKPDDDTDEKPKAEALKLSAPEFSKLYADFICGKLEADAAPSSEKPKRRNRMTQEEPSANGAAH